LIEPVSGPAFRGAGGKRTRFHNFGFPLEFALGTAEGSARGRKCAHETFFRRELKNVRQRLCF
jgi:hypothetical protein